MMHAVYFMKMYELVQKLLGVDKYMNTPGCV
jgi:hypothetical protein